MFIEPINGVLSFLIVSKTLNQYVLDYSYVAVKCHIPIGAEYYVNENGHYVSNKIIVGDIIPDEDLLKR